jgi:anti-anti-sigma factor
MQLTVTEHPNGIAVVTLYGDLDIDTAPGLRAALSRLLTRPTPHIVVDVARLDFCDSMGLTALVTGHQRAVARGGWLRLANPAAFLRQLLDVVGLADHLAVYPDVDQALRAA